VIAVVELDRGDCVHGRVKAVVLLPFGGFIEQVPVRVLLPVITSELVL
jgi:hypothetical protein